MKFSFERIDLLAIQRTFSWPIATRSMLVALVVGTILNAINQGSEILNGGSVSFRRLILTYAVPFFVSSYGAYAAFRRLDSLTGSVNSTNDRDG